MAAEKRPPGVMLYFDKVRPICALLSAKDRGELLLVILDYAELGQEPVFRPGSRVYQRIRTYTGVYQLQQQPQIVKG